MGSVLHERVRGDLHRDVGGTAVPHRREVRYDLERGRRRERRRLLDATEAVVDRAEHAGTMPSGVPDRLEQIRDGRFPVGPGDADHGERAGRIAVEPRGEARKEARRLLRGDEREALRELRRRLDAGDGHGAAAFRLEHVPAAIDAGPGQRHEEVACGNGPRVDAQALDRDVPVAPKLERDAGDSREQLTECHHRATARAADTTARAAKMRTKGSITTGRSSGPG